MDMKLNKFKATRKYFLYTLLCICIFAVITLLGCFVAGNTNVFEWQASGRMGVVITSTVLCFYVVLAKEIIK